MILAVSWSAGCTLDSAPASTADPGRDGEGESMLETPVTGGGTGDQSGRRSAVIITPGEQDAPTLPSAIITPRGSRPGNPGDPTDPGDPLAPGVCGNGVVEHDELCDSAQPCCSADCQDFVAGGRECRAAAGVCDLAEVCTGSDGECPADGTVEPGTECRAASGAPCDVADVCDGERKDCPDRVASVEVICRASSGEACDAPEHCDGETDGCAPDRPSPRGTVCGAPQLPCDAPEVCDGETKLCPPPAMSVAPAGQVCRPAQGPCDADDLCDGSGYACPSADRVRARGEVCRAVAGMCDRAEVCDGVAKSCPAEVVLVRGAVCRGAEQACDVAESCDGQSAQCPVDVPAASGTVCDQAQGACDVAEQCDGSSKACPPPATTVKAQNTECNAKNGVCDVAEVCDGVATSCPRDGVVARGTMCDPGTAGECDLPEVCDGQAKQCPAATATVRARGTVCHAAIGECDAEETCSGAATACPSDQPKPRGTECRAKNGVCDLADTCDGASRDCADRLDSTTVCGPAQHACDLPEVCTGRSRDCPGDQAAPDGTSCTVGTNKGRCSLETCCPGVTIASQRGGLCSLESGERLVFVSSKDSAGNVGFNGADAVCSDVARSANLAGTFHAWLSSRAISAKDRIGQQGAYVRVDGATVQNGYADLINPQLPLLAPISLTEWGVERKASVWTGTNAFGTMYTNPATPAPVDMTCSGWTSTAGEGETGTNVVAKPAWTANAPSVCSAARPFYCFEGTPPPRNAIVFVTRGTIFLGDGLASIADGDRACAQSASSAGLPGNFVAWLSDATTNAIDRVQNRAYFLLDGTRVAASRATLASGMVEAPIAIDETGARLAAGAPAQVWTGTASDGKAAQHCDGWKVSARADGTQGVATTTKPDWTQTPNPAVCRGAGHLYCFEVAPIRID